MSWKKILCGVLTASMVFSMSLFCSAAPESANAKLTRIEIDTYGSEQRGALLDRISVLEKSYSGQNMEGNMNARIEAIYDILYDNSAGPGILAKINSLEWNVNHAVASGGIDMRLTALENQILGKTSEGTFNDRIRDLAKASYGEAILPIAQVQIPADTLIKVATTAPVSSKTMQEGDVIPIKVVEDVFVDGILVFANGLTGEGTVGNVRRAKHIFSNGKIESDFHKLKTIDGQTAQIYTGEAAVEKMTANKMSQGLSLVGQTFSGKNKELEEVLIRGKNVDLAEGVELYVQIKEPIVVYGVRTDGGGISIDEPPSEDVKATEDVEPSEKAEPTEDVKPSGEAEPTEDVKTTEDVEPSEKAEPTEDVKTTEDVKPSEKAESDEPLVVVTPAPADKKPIEDDGEIIEIIDED